MVFLVILMAILLPMLLAAAFLLGRHLHQHRPADDEFSPVTRQHFELFQGAQINEAAVEAAKHCFSDLLERGEVASVEASLRPGMHYVFQIRALAEIGTDVAGRILERQLHRRLTDDHLEQAWYWIDLAGSLRSLNRSESLPHLLRCADRASDVPLGHFFAAETVCFLGFAGYLRRTDTAQGRAAARLLHRALEGLRFGVQPQMVAEARLGETLEHLWDHRNEPCQPIVARVIHEALRFLRRAPHARTALTEDGNDREAFDWQLSHLESLESAFAEYIAEAPPQLLAQVKTARDRELPDLLHALSDLRVEAGQEMLGLLARPRFQHAELAIEVLLWSRQPDVGPWLRDFARKHVAMERRSKWKPHSFAPRRPSLATDVPYRSILRSLRGHPSIETEEFLLLAARDWDPVFRASAVGSLGWREPRLRERVLDALDECRLDPSSEVRQAARAALARLGQRQALQWFRQALTREDFSNIHEAIQVIAAEGLTLLWPELDRLADSENPDIAQLASESLERMAEEMEYYRSV